MFWFSTRLIAQGEATTVFVDLENLDVQLGARLDHFGGVLDVVVGKLGDVDQALDPRQDFHEGAEGDDLGDRALEHVAGTVGR